MKNILLKLVVLFVTGVFVVISCSRNDLSPSEIYDQFAEAEKEAVFEAVLAKADDQINKEIAMLEKYNYNLPAAKSSEAEPCDATIKVETPANLKFPKTISLDFGEGCTDSEGNFRAGKMIVYITGPYWQMNTVRHSRLVDYIYNDLKIVGDRFEINKGLSDKGLYVFEVLNKEKIWTTAGEFLVEREWTRVRTYNRGNDLSTTTDDEVWVTGSARVERAGKKLEKEITVPLYRPLTCQHFQCGTVTTFINKEKISELNYGDCPVKVEGDSPNECDNTATWTNGVKTKIITLKTGINYYKIKL